MSCSVKSSVAASLPREIADSLQQARTTKSKYRFLSVQQERNRRNEGFRFTAGKCACKSCSWKLVHSRHQGRSTKAKTGKAYAAGYVVVVMERKEQHSSCQNCFRCFTLHSHTEINTTFPMNLTPPRSP